MKIQARFVLEPRRNNDVLDNYYNYLSHLFNTHDDFNPDMRANFSFRNYLQSPLQPLADNLEAATYETFENDTIKYERYEEACYKAFVDKLKYGKFKQTEGIEYPGKSGNAQTSNGHEVEVDKKGKNEKIVVLYFGAGRGPLIRRALSAAKKANAEV